MDTCLDVIELDRKLAAHLEQILGSKIRVHQGDVLKFDFHQLIQGEEKLSLIGNLPYNVSTALLMQLIKYRSVLNSMVFMLQEEVVRRICATPNQKTYGRLSVMLQYYFKPEYLEFVPPHSFYPPPKV